MGVEKPSTRVIGTPGGEPVSVEVEEKRQTAAESRSAGRAQSAKESETKLRTDGQRQINLIWEVTQAVIAISVTLGTLWIAGSLLLADGGDASGVAFLLLSNAFFMIMTSYHTRTNHTRIGGVGKDQEGR